MEQQKKGACVLFRTIVEAAKEMDKDEALELLLTYADYALGDTDEIRTDNKYVRLILNQTIPALQASERRRQSQIENGPKGKELGGGVGRPKKGETQEEYQKRVTDWKESKKPLKTPKNPIGDNINENPSKPLKTPQGVTTFENPVKNPVFEKTALECPQNPSKPLDVDVEVDVEKEIDLSKEININKEITKEEFIKNLEILCYKFINKHPDFNYMLDEETFLEFYYDNVVNFQRYVNEQLKTYLTIKDTVLLILGTAQEYQETSTLD